MSKPIEVKTKGLTVKIYVSEGTAKSGKSYQRFQVADYSDGKRKFHTFGSEADARAKALELCEANAKGQQFGDADLARMYLQKHSIQTALRESERVGLEIDEVARLLRQASEIIPASELLQACHFWKDKRPNKPFTPKLLGEAGKDFVSRQGRVTERRKRGLTCHFGQLAEKFPTRPLHEISETDIRDFIDSKKWAPKTINDALSNWGLLFKEAQSRGWVPEGHNPCANIKRAKLPAPVEGGSRKLATRLSVPGAYWFSQPKFCANLYMKNFPC
jgi:hypothetical protein